MPPKSRNRTIRMIKSVSKDSPPSVVWKRDLATVRSRQPTARRLGSRPHSECHAGRLERDGRLAAVEDARRPRATTLRAPATRESAEVVRAGGERHARLHQTLVHRGRLAG